MPTVVSRLLHENYTAVSKDVVGPFLDILTAAREVFRGDLDKLFILLVIAQRSAEHRAMADVDLEDVLSGRVEALPSLHTNVRSIADSTGIPRETVRRKVAEMVKEGWVRRDGDDLSYTPEAVRALTPVREALIAAAGRLHVVVTGLLADAGEAQNGPREVRKTPATA